MTLPLALIAAVARNGVIGAENTLPWRLSGDMKHFRALSMGKPVIMGRKTFQSIGRPLPGRHVIVLSGDPAFRAEGIAVADTPDHAIARADRIGCEVGATEIMVAGGGTLYAALIGRADRLYLTEVDLAPEGDTLFPAIDPAIWTATGRVRHLRGEKDDAAFSTVTYHRRRPL